LDGCSTTVSLHACDSTTIGCESTKNVPARWRNQTVGSFEIRARAGPFRAGGEELFRTLAQLSVPLFLQHESA
ncbi:hypothetical protein, partial [Klebsiella pneumoniae]|uniref:hypothetical protein n=1 Tax=Klebsiella pneumoniae TaxID=573 RepID=UPI001954FFB5